MKTLSIDASSLRNLKCPEKFLDTVYHGLRLPGEKAYKPAFGSAYHKYKAHYLTTGNAIESIQLALQYYATIKDVPTTGAWTQQKLYEACEVDLHEQETWTVFEDSSGAALVEQKFSLPLYKDDTLELYLSGTIDALVDRQGVACFCDHKVTEHWDTNAFISKYLVDHQMILYHKVLDNLAKEHPETFGIFLDCPYFIRMISVSGKSAAKIVTSELMPVCEDKVKKLDGMLEYATQLIINEHRGNPILPMRHNLSCCGDYGTCSYFALCNASSDGERDYEKNHNYIHKEYDPMNFD